MRKPPIPEPLKKPIALAVVAVLCVIAVLAFAPAPLAATAPGMTTLPCKPIKIEGMDGDFCVMAQGDFDTFVRAYSAAGQRAIDAMKLAADAIKRAREAEDRCRGGVKVFLSPS